MSGEVKCTCGFDLSTLPARYRVRPEDGDTIGLSCPLCGRSLDVALQKVGVLVRGTGARTEFFRWKTTSSAPPSTGPQATIGRFQLRFDTLGTIEPREICYARIPVFAGDSGDAHVPTLPVRREFFDCVDMVAYARLQQSGQRADIVGGEYQVLLPLNGLEQPLQVRIPLMTHKSTRGTEERLFRGINLRVWPNAPTTNWRYHLVGIAAAGEGAEALLGSNRVRLFSRTTTGKDWGAAFSAVQRSGDAVSGASNERPRWVAIEVTESGKASDATATSIAGALFEVPPVVERAQGEIRMGLDFGTSNTCVAVDGEMVQAENGSLLLPTPDEKSWNLYLVRGGPEAAAHAGPDLWPAPLGFGASRDSFPSEILFAQNKSAQMHAVDNARNWQYGIDFGLPSAMSQPSYAEADYTLSDFKWREMLEAAAPTFARQLAVIQAKYIASVLLLAYARLVTKYRQAASTVSVEYSYPISFNADDHQSLLEATELAAQLLEQDTGVSWTLTQGVDESVAAAANAGDPGRLIHVYLDMGGGSTDIAVKIRGHNEKFETLYLTSVRYAGMALLSAYEGENKATTCLSSQASVDVLRRRVRESKTPRDVIGDPSLFNKNQEAVRLNRTVHFYGYLTEYVARLIAAGFFDQRFRREGADGTLAFPAEAGVALFFLGNGWKFHALLGEDLGTTLATAIKKRTFELLKEERGPYADEIRALLKKSNLPMSSEPLQNVPHEKAAVAIGLLKPEARQQRRSTGADGSTTRAILGWNTTVDGSRVVPWFAMYDTARPDPPSLADAVGNADAAASDSLDFDATTSSAATGPDASWYRDLPPSPNIDWKDDAPKLPSRLEGPFELDRNLNMTRAALKRRCTIAATRTWFVRGPYEVLIEELFKKKLRTIGA